MRIENIPIREISTLGILVPLILSFIGLKTAEINFRLFFALLLLGLFTDLIGWYTSIHRELLLFLLYASLLYSFCEALFFIWVTTDYIKSGASKKMRISIVIVLVLWFGYLLSSKLSIQGNTSHSSLFDVFYQVVASFLSGFALLNMAEKEDKLTQLPLFWIYTGIFIYCFCTFFIFTIKLTLTEELSNKLWPVHNIVNIIVYILYSIGFWKHRVKLKR